MVQEDQQPVDENNIRKFCNSSKITFPTLDYPTIKALQALQ